MSESAVFPAVDAAVSPSAPPSRRHARGIGSTVGRWLAPVVVAALISTVTVAGSAAAATPEPETASEALTPAHGVLFGAFAGQRGTESKEQAVSALEASAGRKFDVQRMFTGWDDTMPPKEVLAAVQHGRTPILSIEPYRTNGTKVSWAAIAAGQNDADIRRHAAAIKALGVPLFLVFHHESDYASGYGTPAEYRAAYRHYVEVFRAAGVTNVAWTWVLTPASFGSSPSTAGADALYPGDDVVDWAGIDAYNWFGCGSSSPTSWRTTATATNAFRAWGQAHHKPLMLAEYGSVEDSADPQRKAQWYTETMATVAASPEIKVISVFNKTGTCPWWVDSSAASLASFGDIGEQPAAHGRVSAWLSVPKVLGAAPWTMSFNPSKSTGEGKATGSGITSWALSFGDGSPSASGQGTPPTSVGHTYQAGTWAATLTVTDASGATNADTLSVTSAPAPSVSLMERDVHGDTATLRTWVDPHGFAGTVQITWGPVTGREHSGPVLKIGTGAAGFNQALTGLTPGGSITWRATSTTSAGTASAVHTFSTPGPPTSSKSWTESLTSTTVTVGAQVNPHGLATTTWVEYGTSTALGSKTASVKLDGVTYEKTARLYLSGLKSGTKYWYRLVGQNSRGTLSGPLVSFTTRS